MFFTSRLDISERVLLCVLPVNERFNISARDSPLKAPWFDTSTWERKEASSFDDDLAMSVGLATSVWSYREPFISYRVSPCVTIFVYNFIIDRVRHSIHLFYLEQIDLEQSPSFTHIWYRGAVPMERIKTIGGKGESKESIHSILRLRRRAGLIPARVGFRESKEILFKNSTGER